ncbi:hypothetical protein A4G26_16190 [Mycobacterium kansasii]|nr:hypothetical protein A4G26_16190 [Mycobacterium kansasii]
MDFIDTYSKTTPDAIHTVIQRQAGGGADTKAVASGASAVIAESTGNYGAAVAAYAAAAGIRCMVLTLSRYGTAVAQSIER